VGEAIARAAMKQKSHGTAFVHPVAPLMWKSGTCHFVMARVAYVARPAATSRYGEAFTAKKSKLTVLRLSKDEGWPLAPPVPAAILRDTRNRNRLLPISILL
jgi:hypothetical protein